MRSRISRGNGCHDRRSIRPVAAGRGARLSPPTRHSARGAVEPHRGGARGAAAADRRDPSPAALGCGNRRPARAGRRHRALERDELPDELRKGSDGRAHLRVRLSAGRRSIPQSHRGSAHRLPHGNPWGRADSSVFSSGPRPALHDATHARLASGWRRQAQEPARRPGARVGADRSAALERRSGRRTIDQPGIGPTQRVAAPADGEPRRPRPRARARSIVMQAMYLMVAAVVGMQQPIVPRVVVPPLAHVQAALQGVVAPAALDALDALEALDALDALAALDVVDTWDAGVLQDEQDPTDSLWRAARNALNRADYQTAATLYGDLAHRYPNASRAGDALYWAAFALYKNDNLDRARGLLVTQQQRYPKAATLRDGDALLARVQAALAKHGDGEAAECIRRPAPPAAGPGGTRGGSCPGENDDDDLRIAALNGLLQMDATNALPILKKVLAKRDACSAGLRRKAVFIVSQKRGDETEDILLDVARRDPDSEVRQQAVFWLSQVGSDRAVTASTRSCGAPRIPSSKTRRSSRCRKSTTPAPHRSCATTPPTSAPPTRHAKRRFSGWASSIPRRTPPSCEACTRSSPGRT